MVLGDIVKVLALRRDDLNGAERLLIQHRHRELAPADLLFHNDTVAVAKNLLQRAAKLLPRLRKRHADGGAAPHHLHRAGNRQRLRQRGDLLRRIVELLPCRGVHAAAFHDALGHSLVHGHTAAQRAGAGIGHAQQIKRGLDLSVFSVLPVQAQIHTVGELADLQYVFSDPAVALILAGRANRGQIRRCFFDTHLPAAPIRRVKQLLKRDV